MIRLHRFVILSFAFLPVAILYAQTALPGAPAAAPHDHSHPTVHKRLAFLPEVLASYEKNQTLTKKEVIDEYAHYLEQMLSRVPEGDNKRINTHMQEIVQTHINKMFIKVIAKADGITIKDEDVANELVTIKRQIGQSMIARQLQATGKTKEAFETELKLQNKTLEAAELEMGNQQFPRLLQAQRQTLDGFKAMIREKVIIDKWITSKVRPQIKVGPEQITIYYNENKAKFRRPATVAASHILVKVDRGATAETKQAALNKINDLKAQLDKGADFATLAKTHSQCPSSRQGGSLGNFTKGRMVPAFEKAAFALNKGDTSDAVETPFGYHLIKVTDKKDSHIQELDGALKKELKARLKQEQGQAIVMKRLKDYSASVNFKYHF